MHNDCHYELLAEDHSAQDRKVLSYKRWMSRTFLTERISSFVALILAISVVTNLILSAQILRHGTNEPAPGRSRSNVVTASLYSHLPREVGVTDLSLDRIGYDSKNDTHLDEVWEAIDINDGVLAIPDDWAAQYNLAPTQRFPWDHSKGIYTLTAFHDLHCLKYIHRFVYDAHHDFAPSRKYDHVKHCLESLRRDIMCNADDFPMSTPSGKFGSNGPQGPARQCRDWGKFLAWTQQFNSCYGHITDDHEDFDEIERYKFCPQDSPYARTAQSYFEVLP